MGTFACRIDSVTSQRVRHQPLSPTRCVILRPSPRYCPSPQLSLRECPKDLLRCSQRSTTRTSNSKLTAGSSLTIKASRCQSSFHQEDIADNGQRWRDIPDCCIHSEGEAGLFRPAAATPLIPLSSLSEPAGAGPEFARVGEPRASRKDDSRDIFAMLIQGVLT